MKKHLFFAFAAAAVLASCSSHDDFDNYSAGTPQAPVDDNSPQEILLGVGAQANVATRGTGTVGGDHNNIGDDGQGDTYNKWQKQRINVYMFNKYEVDDEGTATRAFELATETEGGVDYIYNNALFMTPNGETSGAARHIDNPAADPIVDYKRSYYPMNGNFDFWAYRLDDANYKYETTYNYKTFEPDHVAADYEPYKVRGNAMYSQNPIQDPGVDVADGAWVDVVPENGNYYPVYVKTTTNKVLNNVGPTVTPGDIATANITVPFIIDGSQDVMAASTELTAADADKLNGGTGVVEQTVKASDYYDKPTFQKYARSLYSAKTARKGVQPNLKFKHLLTRFTFDAKQMADATNDGVGNDNEAVRIKKIEVKSKINGQIVATYRNVDPEGTAGVPTGLNYVIESVMNTTGDAEESLQLKKRPDTDNNPETAPDQNEPLVDLTEGTQAYEYIVLAENTVVNNATGSGATYSVGDKAAESDITGGTYREGTDYKKIELNGIKLITTDYTGIGEALLVMPGEREYVMDITVEQTVYGRETANGTGVATSKEVKTQTIKGLKIKAADVLGGSHPNNGESEETSANLETFAAGNSYNVRVQVYGLTKIEVQTTLEPWIEGGHIDLDPDNQF